VAYLYYGTEVLPAEIPDRVLAHVKIVIATKLRRNESFMLSWRHPVGSPEGRTSIWMQPSIPLRFVFDSAEPEAIDHEYLKDLANAANSNQGLFLTWDGEHAHGAVPAPERVPMEALAA
jgi:hypothetical protein